MKTWCELTASFPFKFDVEAMKSDLRKIDEENLLVDHYDLTLDRGWRAALLVSKGGQMSGRESQRPSWDFSDFRRTPLADRLPYFKSILDFFDEHGVPQGRMRVLRLAPGAGIGLHRDVGAEVGCLAFRQVRLHVPIITNDKVTFHVGGEVITMRPGHFYYVNFSKKHFVRNDGTEARYHLVMDLKVNAWLRQFFPPTTMWEEIEFAVARATWPPFWRVRQQWIRLTTWGWKVYEGSPTQRVVHWLKGRHRKQIPAS
jgi:hypothetical protein